MLKPMALFATLSLLAFCSPSADAQKEKPKPKPKPREEKVQPIFPDLKVGKTGYWCVNGYKSSPFQTRVVEVIDKQTMIMRLGDNPPFMVKSYPTADLADDQIHELPNEWRVTGTQKHQGRTYHVVQPTAALKDADKDKKKDK